MMYLAQMTKLQPKRNWLVALVVLRHLKEFNLEETKRMRKCTWSHKMLLKLSRKLLRYLIIKYEVDKTCLIYWLWLIKYLLANPILIYFGLN